MKFYPEKNPGRFKYPVPMKKSNLKKRLLHPLRLYFRRSWDGNWCPST